MAESVSSLPSGLSLICPSRLALLYSVSVLHTQQPQMSGLLLLPEGSSDPLLFPLANLSYWSQAEVGKEDSLQGLQPWYSRNWQKSGETGKDFPMLSNPGGPRALWL